MNNKEKFYKLFKILKGWNLDTYYKIIHFDFYNKKGNAILTLNYNDDNDTLHLSDNVEFYYNDIDYKNITLNEYRTIGELNNDYSTNNNKRR